MSAKVMLLIFLSMLLCVLLVACERPKYKGNEKYITYILFRNIPVAETDGKSEVVEVDSFKRELIKYVTEYKCVYIVCQKHDQDYTYFYEDYNFIITDLVSGDTQKINELKETNDWDKPINEDKLSSRELHPSGTSSKYNWVKADKLIKDNLISKEDRLKSEFEPIDYDKNGKILYFIRIIDRISLATTNYYFMILDRYGTYDGENFLTEVADIYNYQDQLHDLKQKNGWSFKKR